MTKLSNSFSNDNRLNRHQTRSRSSVAVRVIGKVDVTVTISWCQKAMTEVIRLRQSWHVLELASSLCMSLIVVLTSGFKMVSFSLIKASCE